MTAPSTPPRVVAACLLVAACGAPADEREAEPAPPAEARRVPNCSPAAGRVTFLVPDAQECWYPSPDGRWRIRSHDMHYDVLVVRTVAERLEAAGEIGRLFVDRHGDRYREISVYVEQEPGAAAAQIRRVVWTRAGGFSYLDFPAE